MNRVEAFSKNLYLFCDSTAGLTHAARIASDFFHFGSNFYINKIKIWCIPSVLRDVKLTRFCITQSSVFSRSHFVSSCHCPDLSFLFIMIRKKSRIKTISEVGEPNEDFSTLSLTALWLLRTPSTYNNISLVVLIYLSTETVIIQT